MAGATLKTASVLRNWRFSAILLVRIGLALGCALLVSSPQTLASELEGPKSSIKSKVLNVTFTGKPDSEPRPLLRQMSIRKDAPKSEWPFWKSKPEVYRKIAGDRAVIVSVTKEGLESEKKVYFSIRGAGLVSAPQAFAFATAQNYPKLKEVSGHFKTVEYDATRNKLFLILEALGYQARMILEIVPVTEDWRSELQWEVVWGSFQGMKGIIGFEPYSASQSEVSLHTEYKSESLPLPKVLMGFALEVITQKVAERMRSFIEKEYSSRPKPVKDSRGDNPKTNGGM